MSSNGQSVAQQSESVSPVNTADDEKQLVYTDDDLVLPLAVIDRLVAYPVPVRKTKGESTVSSDFSDESNDTSSDLFGNRPLTMINRLVNGEFPFNCINSGGDPEDRCDEALLSRMPEVEDLMSWYKDFELSRMSQFGVAVSLPDRSGLLSAPSSEAPTRSYQSPVASDKTTRSEDAMSCID